MAKEGRQIRERLKDAGSKCCRVLSNTTCHLENCLDRLSASLYLSILRPPQKHFRLWRHPLEIKCANIVERFIVRTRCWSSLTGTNEKRQDEEKKREGIEREVKTRIDRNKQGGRWRRSQTPYLSVLFVLPDRRLLVLHLPVEVRRAIAFYKRGYDENMILKFGNSWGHNLADCFTHEPKFLYVPTNLHLLKGKAG